MLLLPRMRVVRGERGRTWLSQPWVRCPCALGLSVTRALLCGSAPPFALDSIMTGAGRGPDSDLVPAASATI